MTVGELIDALCAAPDDGQVILHVDGIYKELDEVEVSTNGDVELK